MGFAERLKEAMKRKGVGVAEFASQVPVEPNSVSRWRAGYIPGPVHLARVAALLNVSTGFLKDGEPIDPPPGMTLGHVVREGSSATVKEPLKSEPPQPLDDEPARPLQPQLPEPATPRNPAEWTASLVVYEAAKNDLKRRRESGELSPEQYTAVYFWINRLAVAAEQDRASAAPSKPNGLDSAG